MVDAERLRPDLRRQRAVEEAGFTQKRIPLEPTRVILRQIEDPLPRTIDLERLAKLHPSSQLFLIADSRYR